jgi:hypothetical protein
MVPGAIAALTCALVVLACASKSLVKPEVKSAVPAAPVHASAASSSAPVSEALDAGMAPPKLQASSVPALSSSVDAKRPTSSVDGGRLASSDAGKPVTSDLVCDNDANADFDCASIDLGTCGAGKMYSCPRQEHIPVGKGFRPGIAANIGRCYAATPGWKSGDGSRCVAHVEHCVRKAVHEACPDRAALDTCKSVLSWCSPELQVSCAKVLSAQEPKLREESTKYLREAAARGKATQSCGITWDFNGYPFCPFCSFGR